MKKLFLLRTHSYADTEEYTRFETRRLRSWNLKHYTISTVSLSQISLQDIIASLCARPHEELNTNNNYSKTFELAEILYRTTSVEPRKVWI